MTFVHPLLLGGLLLVGLPVLIHLLMQQKPKRLPFPAFRFLVQKQRTNQRTLRLRHLLLLLLRMAVIAALCLALVRPRLSAGGGLPTLTGDRPVSAVLILDTSASLEYTVAGRSWLDEARRRALELLDELPEGSRVAVLDSGEVGGDWAPSLGLARERLQGLRLRHANAPLPRQLEQAFRLLAEPAPGDDGEPPPKVVAIFTDRTRACWDEAAARGLNRPDDVTALLIDVGSDSATDVAITEVRPEKGAFWPGETVTVNVSVQAFGKDAEAEVICLFDGEANGERRPVRLTAGRGEVLAFVRSAGGRGLGEGLHQVEVRLAASDALAFTNLGFATFRVLGGRRVLVLSDEPARDGPEWKRRLSATFQPEVRAADDADTIDFSAYNAVLLAHLRRPRPELWPRLEAFATAGGGVAVLPGRAPELAAYSSPEALRVLPGRLVRPVEIKEKDEARWAELESGLTRSAHPFLTPFRRWRATGTVDFFLEEAARPGVRRFWQVERAGEGTDVVARYTDRDASPALVERMLGRGRVLLLTTPLEPRREAPEEPWTNYFGLNSSFGLVLTNLLAGYLAGDTEEVPLNFVAGQTPSLTLPPRPFAPRYVLAGPGIVGAGADLPRAPEQTELRVPQAQVPGNFSVLDPDGRRVAAFSVAASPEETDLGRVPIESIEAILGPGSVLPVGRSTPLGELLQERTAPPLELAPSLLVLLLVALALEGFLANRFYRRSREEKAAMAA